MKKILFFVIVLINANLCLATAKEDSAKMSTSTELAKDYYEFSKQNIIEAKNKVDSYIAQTNRMMTIFGWVFSVIGLLLTITGLWTKYEIKKKLEEQDKTIGRLLETESWTVNLRKNARIILLYKKGTENSKSIEKILSCFPKLFIKEVTDLKGSYSHDIIFINDENEKFSKGMEPDYMKKTVEKLLVENEELFIYYFGEAKNMKPDNNTLSLRLTYANSYSQIYVNLMNTLKVRDIILYGGNEKKENS